MKEKEERKGGEKKKKKKKKKKRKRRTDGVSIIDLNSVFTDKLSAKYF